MNEKDATPAETSEGTPRVWDEQAVSLLVEQMRFMMEHSVKNMKLEVIENLGAMLARRSGIDRELHDLAARVELLGKSIASFGVRLSKIEKREPLPVSRGPRGTARNLSAPPSSPIREEVPVPARRAPPPAPEIKKRGRGRPRGPSGKAQYPHDAAIQRARRARGTS
jgi:hypothetical protein